MVQYGDAASLLAKLCPRGGRAAKQRRTVGRLAEVLCVSSLAGVRAWSEVNAVVVSLPFFCMPGERPEAVCLVSGLRHEDSRTAVGRGQGGARGVRR